MANISLNLSLPLESFYDSDSMDFDECLDCSHVAKSGAGCELYAGFRLEVSQQPQSMRQVANLIIALQRMKHSHKLQSSEFSDDELYSIIMENVVEECVVEKMQDPTYNSAKTFSKTGQGLQCTVSDMRQKSLVLTETGEAVPELQAITLQGGNFSHRVRMNLSFYMTPRPTNTEAQPVTLCIAKRNLYLSCSMDSGTPHLQLEVVHNKEQLKTINAQGDMARFLFFRESSGVSINSFESAKFRGWFISTALDSSDPDVEMCSEQTATRLTSFKFNEKTII